MFHHPHHFGWADHVRRTQTERLHQQMPIKPMFGHDRSGWPHWWLWSLLGLAAGVGFLVVVGGMVG